jgi:hypothetical protein
MSAGRRRASVCNRIADREQSGERFGALRRVPESGKLEAVRQASVNRVRNDVERDDFSRSGSSEMSGDFPIPQNPDGADLISVEVRSKLRSFQRSPLVWLNETFSFGSGDGSIVAELHRRILFHEFLPVVPEEPAISKQSASILRRILRCA